MTLLRAMFVLLLLLITPHTALTQSVGPAITEGLQTCENGLRRCSALSENAAAYWYCMEDTCTDEIASSYDATCATGQQVCRPKLSEYRACIDLICLNPRGRFIECEAGKRQCGNSVQNYWNCVHQSCLGGVEQFVQQAQKQADQHKNAINTERDQKRGYRQEFKNGVEFRYDLNGELIPPVLGVPNRFRYPQDSAVTPADHRLAGLPLRQLKGTAGATLACRHPSARLHCGSRDMSSCTCSNGSPPYFINATPVVAVAEPYSPGVQYDLPDVFVNNADQAEEAFTYLRNNIQEGIAQIRQVEAEAKARAEAEKR